MPVTNSWHRLAATHLTECQHRTFKKMIVPTLQQLFRDKRKGNFLKSFYEVNVILIQNQAKTERKKKSTGQSQSQT